MIQRVLPPKVKCHRCKEVFDFYNDEYVGSTKKEYYFSFRLGRKLSAISLCESCYKGFEKFLKEI